MIKRITPKRGYVVLVLAKFEGQSAMVRIRRDSRTMDNEQHTPINP
jgi:hypothetical protein